MVQEFTYAERLAELQDTDMAFDTTGGPYDWAIAELWIPEANMFDGPEAAARLSELNGVIHNLLDDYGYVTMCELDPCVTDHETFAKLTDLLWDMRQRGNQ